MSDMGHDLVRVFDILTMARLDFHGRHVAPHAWDGMDRKNDKLFGNFASDNFRKDEKGWWATMTSCAGYDADYRSSKMSLIAE